MRFGAGPCASGLGRGVSGLGHTIRARVMAIRELAKRRVGPCSALTAIQGAGLKASMLPKPSTLSSQALPGSNSVKAEASATEYSNWRLSPLKTTT